MIKGCFQFTHTLMKGANVGLRFVILAACDRKILKPVVIPYSVQVMNAFVLTESSTDRLFHDEAMFKRTTAFAVWISTWRDLNVAVFSNNTSTSPARMRLVQWIGVVLSSACFEPTSAQMRGDVAREATKAFSDFYRRVTGYIQVNYLGNWQALRSSWPSPMSLQVINHMEHFSTEKIT